MGSSEIKVLICLPTYNEAENIEWVLLKIQSQLKKIKGFTFSILNIDDNSPDGTAKIAKRSALQNSIEFNQIINSKKLGLGPAYLSGFNWGLTKGFEYFVEFDADGSHLIEELPNLLAEALSNDLVIGSRWIAGGSVKNWPMYRRVISRLGTGYAAIGLNLPYRDMTSGFRVLHRDLVEMLLAEKISSHGYSFQIETILKSHLNGAAIAEVPITFVERTAGRSKMTLSIAWEAFIKVTLWSARYRLRTLFRR